MEARPLKIDLEGGKGYTGLGDLVMLAWLAEGCRRVGQPIRFHRTRHLDLTSVLGLAVDPEPGGVPLDRAYEAELADRGRRPRLDYVRDQLGITAVPARPALSLAAGDRAWAAASAREYGCPLVLLFPQTAWATREWPASYWVDLAWRLRASGVPAVVMLSHEDPRFTNTPFFVWGTPLPRVAALMEQAALVVGSDSFPAHLAGVVGVPAIALLGPTRPTVFAHAASVECLSSAAIDCTGCHFAAPFRAACDQGCQSLYRLFPEVVFRRVLERLQGASTETPGLDLA